MEYPRLVYISPGQNKCVEGSFDFEKVNDEKDHKAAIDAGFSDSVPEAIKAASIKKESLKLKDEKPVFEKPSKVVKK